jgi:hypothetical protein
MEHKEKSSNLFPSEVFREINERAVLGISAHQRGVYHENCLPGNVSDKDSDKKEVTTKRNA